jgi:hypothetical protein
LTVSRSFVVPDVDREWDDGVVIEPARFVVDGESFDVVRDGSSTHLTWVSGPNASYGFSVGGSGATRLSDAEIGSAIRSFLSEIDPRTGYLAD